MTNWQSLTVGVTEKIVIGSAETLVAWDPDAKTGNVRLLFNRSSSDELITKLPKQLRPGGGGGMPSLDLASLAEAKAALKEVVAFYKKQHPKLTTKSQGKYMKLDFGDDDAWWILTHEDTAGGAIAKGARPEGWTLPCGKDRVLLWNSAPTGSGTVHVRATDDEVMFADEQSDAEGTPPTDLGTWTFESVLVAMPATQAVTGIKGVKTRSAAAIAALAAKESPRKIRHAQGDTISIATIVRLRGSFRAESSATPRWLRFSRI